MNQLQSLIYICMYHYDIMFTASMVYIDFGQVTGCIRSLISKKYDCFVKHLI